MGTVSNNGAVYGYDLNTGLYYPVVSSTPITDSKGRQVVSMHGGFYQVAPQAHVDGDFVALQTDRLGNLQVNMNTYLAGEDAVYGVQVTQERWQFFPITTKTTNLVKPSPGFIRGITINKIGTADTLVIYNNTAASGSILASITVQPNIPFYPYFAQMNTGITVVSGGGVAGDYTVIYA
jgi:hypothetical protein